MEAGYTEQTIGRALGLLGGEPAIHARIRNEADMQAVLLKGLPLDALLHLISEMGGPNGDVLLKVAGLSRRTLQRRKANPTPQVLSVDQSAHVWRFARTFAQAIILLGAVEDAARWMAKPAMGLANQRPIDCLGTPVEAGEVGDYLGRLEYGVYT